MGADDQAAAVCPEAAGGTAPAVLVGVDRFRLGIELGPKVFSFDTFQRWVNHAPRAWRAHGLRPDYTVCIDQKGRIVNIGAHFMAARDEGAFPVDVYLLRADMAQAWRARMERAGVEGTAP